MTKDSLRLFLALCFLAQNWCLINGGKVGMLVGEVNLSAIVSHYNYKKTDIYTSWKLNPYAKIGESLLAKVKKDAPYELLREVVMLSRGAKSATVNSVKSKYMAYSKPYIAMAICSFVFSVILATVGISYCVVSLFGKCGKVSDVDVPDYIASISRFVHLSSLGLTAIFVIMSGAATSSASQRFGKGVILARTLTDDTFKNLLEFQTKTVADIKTLMVEQLNKAGDRIIDDIDGVSKVATNIVKSSLTDTSAMTRELTSLEKDLPSITANMTSRIQDVALAQLKFMQDARALEQNLNGVNRNITLAKTMCAQNHTLNATGICQSPQFSAQIHLTVNVTAMVNVTNGFVVVLGNLSKKNLTAMALDINATVAYFASKAFNTSALKKEHLEKMSETLKKERDAVFREIETKLLHRLTKVFLSKEKQILAMFDKNGIIGKMENIRYQIMNILALTSLVLGLILAFCVVLGVPVVMFGPAGRFRSNPLLASIVMKITLTVFHSFFVCGLPLLIVLGIMVALCGCLTQTCIGLQNGSVLKKVGDDSVTWGGRVMGLQSIVPSIPEHITVSSMMNVCGSNKNATIWNAAKLNTAYNLRKILKQDEMQNPVAFFGMGSLFGEGTVNNSILDLNEFHINLTKQLTSFNFTRGYTGPLLSANLTEFTNNLKSFSTEVARFDIRLAKLIAFGDAREGPADGGMKGNVDKVYEAMKRALHAQGKAAVLAKKAVEKVASAVESAKNINNVLSDAKGKFINQTSKAIKVLDQFIVHSETQMNENIGKCSFLTQSYNNGIDIYCSYLVAGLNIVWISLVVTIFVFTLFIASFVKIIKYYRLVGQDAADQLANSYARSWKGQASFY